MRERVGHVLKDAHGSVRERVQVRSQESVGDASWRDRIGLVVHGLAGIDHGARDGAGLLVAFVGCTIVKKKRREILYSQLAA